MTTDERILETLLAIHGVLKTLAEQPDRGRGADGQRVKPADRRALEVLLPAIHGAFRGDGWLVRDLFASSNKALQTALQTTGLDAHRLGKLFKRTAGQCMENFRVERIGDTRDGALLNVTMTR